MSTPNERAKQLLTIHKGHCFVPGGHELISCFHAMENAGEVKISPSTTGIAGVNVCRVGAHRVYPLPRSLKEGNAF